MMLHRRKFTYHVHKAEKRYNVLFKVLAKYSSIAWNPWRKFSKLSGPRTTASEVPTAESTEYLRRPSSRSRKYTINAESLDLVQRSRDCDEMATDSISILSVTKIALYAQRAKQPCTGAACIRQGFQSSESLGTIMNSVVSDHLWFFRQVNIRDVPSDAHVRIGLQRFVRHAGAQV